MLKIPVILINGSLTETNSEGLHAMLDKKAIIAFQRSSGWAIVGRDDLRGKRSCGHGSWKDRKVNPRSPKELTLLPQLNGHTPSAVGNVTWAAKQVALNPRLKENSHENH